MGPEGGVVQIASIEETIGELNAFWKVDGPLDSASLVRGHKALLMRREPGLTFSAAASFRECLLNLGNLVIGRMRVPARAHAATHSEFHKPQVFELLRNGDLLDDDAILDAGRIKKELASDNVMVIPAPHREKEMKGSGRAPTAGLWVCVLRLVGHDRHDAERSWIAIEKQFDDCTECFVRLPAGSVRWWIIHIVWV